MIRQVLKVIQVSYRYDLETLIDVFNKVRKDYPKGRITSDECGSDSVGQFVKFTVQGDINEH